MTNLVDTGIAYFNDPNKGRPIWNGYVYVGEPDTDPDDIPSNLKSISVRTADNQTIAVSQPLRTNTGGNPVYNGEPVQVLVDGNYSLLVQDNAQRDKFYIRNNALGATVTALDLAANGVYLWDSGYSYEVNDYCIDTNGVMYISLTNSNTGNDPSTDDGTNWIYYSQAKEVFSIADLQSIDPIKSNKRMYLNLGQRSGDFIWETGDYSSQVGDDTYQSAYIESNITAAAQGAWVRAGFTGHITSEQLGMSSSAVDNAERYISVAGSEFFRSISIASGTFDFNVQVDITRGSSFLTKGAGKGVTLIRFMHFFNGILMKGNGTVGVPSTYVSGLNFEDFSVSRPDYESFVGLIGAKSLFTSISLDSHYKRVEEQNAIGFGIQFDDSRRCLVQDCYVHDHFGGADGPSGTDGIHFYRCQEYKANRNLVERVADDAISSGSFEPSNSERQAKRGIYSNNICREVGNGSAFKAYSYIDDLKIYGNSCYEIGEGAVYLTNDFNSPANSIVENVDIFDNYFEDCQGEASTNTGAFRFRFWPSGGGETALIRNIKFHDNTGVRCRVLFSTEAQTDLKTMENVSIYDNKFTDFEEPAGASGTNYAIFLTGCRGYLNIERNIIRDSLGAGIICDIISGVPSYEDCITTISDNEIRNFNTTGEPFGRGIWFRSGNKNNVVNINRNKIFGAFTPDGGTSDRAILTGSLVNPTSTIEGNQTDASTTGFSFSASAPAAFKGDLTNKYAIATPTTGTHYLRSRIAITTLTIGQPSVVMCSNRGTFGTLVGVTADTTSGSRTVTVNDASGLTVGEVITIGAAYTRAEIIGIDGNDLRMSSDASATLATEPVAYEAPTFIDESTWA